MNVLFRCIANCNSDDSGSSSFITERKDRKRRRRRRPRHNKERIVESLSRPSSDVFAVSLSVTFYAMHVFCLFLQIDTFKNLKFLYFFGKSILKNCSRVIYLIKSVPIILVIAILD